MLVQALVAQAPVEAFIEAVLLRLVGRDVTPLDRTLLLPAQAYPHGRIVTAGRGVAVRVRGQPDQPAGTTLRERGFNGTHRQVHRFVAERRTRPTRRTARKWLVRTSLPVTDAIPLPSPKRLAWFLTQPVEGRLPHATAAVGRIGQDPEAARFGELAQRFAALVRSCFDDDSRPLDPAGELDFWLDAARLSGIPALETFAAGLERDGAAVRAALTTSWSNGQAEGQISRLKMLKRTMYGRAGFPLLRRRFLLAV